MDPAIFFPERGANANKAKATCAGCPVATECGAAGLLDDHGIWGGQSQRDRQHTRVALGSSPGRRHDRPTGCGTEAGAWVHRKAGEALCDECRVARNAGDRRRTAAARTARMVAA